MGKTWKDKNAEKEPASVKMAKNTGFTIRQAYIMMGFMLKTAVENDVIPKQQLNGVCFNKTVSAVNDIHFLKTDG